jgi:uncharacterized membrane protein
MNSIIASSLAGLVTFATLDYLWLAKIAKHMYLSKLLGHVTVEDGALVPYVPAIPLVYIVALLGIFVFVLPKAHSLFEAFLYGALMGFVMYAFYDLTNLATLKDYPWSLTILDTIWGTLLVGTVSLIMFFVQSLVA